MDSILNEITYSDGRMDMQKTQFVDTPAKLKLRERTFDGIRRSLDARRSPIKQENDFNIPSAFMAMEISADGANGGNSGFRLLNHSLENTAMAQKGKRLKVSAQQRDLFIRKQAEQAVSVPTVEVENANVVSESVAPVAPEVQPTAVVPEIVANTVPVENVAPEVQTVEAVVTPEVAHAPMDPLDVAREKVLQNVAVAPVVADNGAVDAILHTNDFAKLQDETALYTQAQKDYQAAMDLKEQKASEKDAAEARRNSLADEIDRKRLDITEQTEVRDSMQKSNSELESEIAETKKEIAEKRRIFQQYTAQVQKDRDRALKAVEALDGQIHTIQTDTANKEKQLENMNVEYQTLTDEANEATARRSELQEELTRLKEIAQAIQLPEGMEMSSDNDAIQMPDFVVEDDYDEYVEGRDKVMGKRAA